MEDFDDDFGELYADVEVQASSAINGVPNITNLYIEQSNKVGNDSSNVSHSIKIESGLGGDERREKGSGDSNGGENEVEVEVERESGSGSDSDDDFDVVVNDDDFGAKNGRENRNAGEDEENMIVPVNREGGSSLKNRDGIDGGGMMEQSGSGYGGERGYVGKNGCHSQYKFVRQHESVSMGNQRVISSSRGDKEDMGYIQNRRTSLARVGPSYAGTFPGLSEHGSGFWLPWNRSILDVDIGMFEQKPWTLPGADMTDYFNFGFDEGSWKSYCQSLDQLRRQSFSQRQNQVNRSRSKLDNDTTATEEVENGAVNEKSIHNEDIMGMQIGQAIHVEDSYIERQPSMDARPPRTRDSDVVIEITMQDPEDYSSGKAESDKIQKTPHAVSEDGRSIDNVEPQTEKSTGYKSRDMAKNSVEENIQSPSASSELKRSFESGTGSSLMLQDSSRHGKGRKSKSDALHSGKVDAFSRGYSRAVEKLNNSTEDVNTNSADTNPCVAGIDVLFDDQIQSSPTPSDSVTWSKAPEHSDHCDLKRIKDCQRSSADSVLVGPVAEYDHLVSRENERGDIRVKGSAGKRHSRARSPTEERKHHYQRVLKHSVVSKHNNEDDSYHIGIRQHIYDRSPLNAHRHRSKAKPHVSTFHEDRPRYRERESSLGYYDKRIVEHKTSCMREFYHRDHRGSRDEIGLCSPRGWDEDTFFSETRVKRTKGETHERERYLHEREGIIWDREQLFQNQPHFTSRYSVDIERRNLRKDFDDVIPSMRSRHELSLEYGYSDDPVLERYARPYPLNCREAEHLDLEIERVRHFQRIGREVGTSGRGDRYLGTPPLDVDYPWYIRDEDGDWIWQASRPNHDYLDRHHAYTERRHGSTIHGDDVDDPQLFENRRRHDRYISHRNVLDDRQLYYHIHDSHDRPDTVRNLDVDDYVVREQNDFHSKGMSWTEDKRSNRDFYNDLYDVEELDYFEGVSRHKWHGNRSEFPDGMSTHMQITKHKQRIVRGDSNSCDTRSKMPTGVEHQKIGIWCRNAAQSRHVVRERKTVQPSGKYSKSGRDPDNELHESGTNNTKEIRAVNIEAINHDKLHAKNHNNASDDLEEGQILPTEEPRKEILKANRVGRKRMSHNQKVTNQNDLNVYDENRILETMAKMEKRRERFKEPILPKKETDSDPKPQVDPVVQTADESKQQRPLRKRRWGGS